MSSECRLNITPQEIYGFRFQKKVAGVSPDPGQNVLTLSLTLEKSCYLENLRKQQFHDFVKSVYFFFGRVVVASPNTEKTKLGTTLTTHTLTHS